MIVFHRYFNYGTLTIRISPRGLYDDKVREPIFIRLTLTPASCVQKGSLPEKVSPVFALKD